MGVTTHFPDISPPEFMTDEYGRGSGDSAGDHECK